MFPHEVRTPRLVLTRLSESDLPDLFAMYADPRVMATLGGLRTREKTEELLRSHLAHWDRHGFGRWAARDPATGRFVGRGGLMRVTVGGADEVEVGYAVVPEFWGRGLATELAAASVRAGFESLGLADLVCFTLPTNAASRRVMEKAGFCYEREGVYADLPHVFFRLTAAGWRSAGAARDAGQTSRPGDR